MALLLERARVEGRTLSNMVERLLSLGLGQVVDEGDGNSGRRRSMDIAGSNPAAAPSPSSTSCPRANHHRRGEWCKACGVTPA